MAPVLLKEFTLALPVDTFVEAFWLNSHWYERFLVDKLRDIDVSIEEWACSAADTNIKNRRVRCFHPSNISFPGLPSHAESLKSQSLEVSTHNENLIRAIIRESNSFCGIPYADYFTVHTEWVAASDPGKSECSVHIYLEVRFVKSTWLQGTIESNTKAEILQVVETWLEFANHYIRQQNWISTQKIVLPSSDTGERKVEESYDDEGVQDYDEERSLPSVHSKTDSDAPSIYLSDEEDALFYDCEEGERALLMKPVRRSSSTARSLDGNFPAIVDDSKQRRPGRPGHAESTRDLAVNIVETIIVLAQFSFWQVYQFYAYDLKELFNIEPDKVVTRMLNSFLPGYHSPLLIHPDLYGPLLAVLLLPQTLLLSMEASLHGCNPTSQLGNAVIVCVLIWLGLAALYRLLALVVAPSIGIKQCLSILGYSFFSWNLALLCTLPLEQHLASTSLDSLIPDHLNAHNVTLANGIHSSTPTQLPASSSGLLPMAMFVPLVIFGLPCSIAQGYVFWEHTPASSLTLQPSALPHSFQQFATQNSRCLQRLLWAFPKILAFVLVAGTHYQLLWYIARVFLPGRRQLCRLSALMQPSQYADILTQKDLRVFALKLLSGRMDED